MIAKSEHVTKISSELDLIIYIKYINNVRNI